MRLVITTVSNNSGKPVFENSLSDKGLRYFATTFEAL